MNSRFKLFLPYIFATLFLFIAIFLSFTKTDFYKIQHLKSILNRNPNFLQSLLSILNQKPQNPRKIHEPNPLSTPSPCVLWMAPFLSGGGYSSESWSYILALNDYSKKMKDFSFRLSIEHHGDLESLEFFEGLPQDVKNLAFELYQTQCRINETIVVCHSEPGAWNPPLFETLPCPPTGDYRDFRFVIGRTMFETDRVNVEHVRRCNRMDSVWVPTDFHVSSFVQSGVHRSKVVKIIQPVDVEFFNPSLYEPFDLASVGDLVLGTKPSPVNSKVFAFLSVFKWEHRKGWDVLLTAYLKQFSKVDGVVLYLLTNPYHCDRDFDNKIVEFVEDSGIEKPEKGWAPIYVIDSHIAQVEFPRVYRAVDVFVLPTRGEGWGRPVVEAMAMSLPVIVTNWSGPTEYLTEENSYPLPVETMSEVMEGPFKGHLWAEPSISKLQALMRHVMSNVEEAEAKGRKAREDIIRRFAPEVVAGIVADHIQTILIRQ